MQFAGSWGDKGKGIQRKVMHDINPKRMTDEFPTQVTYSKPRPSPYSKGENKPFIITNTNCALLHNLISYLEPIHKVFT